VNEFSVTARRLTEGCYVIAPVGEVDMHTAPRVERELGAAIDDGGRDIVVDLSDASLIESTFLGVLTAAHKQLNGHGGRISLVCGDRKLGRIFEITGLDQVFPIHPTLAHAYSLDGQVDRWARLLAGWEIVVGDEQRGLAVLRRHTILDPLPGETAGRVTALAARFVDAPRGFGSAPTELTVVVGPADDELAAAALARGADAYLVDSLEPERLARSIFVLFAGSA
jgi:anti-sigma B factor antagonist